MDEKRRIEIGQRIKRFRGQMRQHQVAEELGVSTRTYQTWEAGDNATDLEHYEKLAALFGVPVAEIIGTENGEPPWVAEIKAQLQRIEAELQDLRESVGQAVVARAASADAPGQPEAQPETERDTDSTQTP